MFVGIIQGLGRIIAKTILEKGLSFSIAYPTQSGLKIGDSISVNGVCLTVTEFNDDHFKVQLVQETLNKTNLGTLSIDDYVNIEYSAKVGDSIGGHMVQGHVDTTGSIKEIWQEGVAKWIRISLDPKWQLFLVAKGFISLDGASLTVVEANESDFTVTLIPHTQAHTISQYYKVGTPVNLEFDIFAKQIQRSREEPYGEQRHALEQLKSGGIIVLVDDDNRENEGDLVMAAEFATAEAMNFMIKKAGGIVCLSVEENHLKKFNIGMQPVSNANKLAANFSVSVDATQGITTGVSAADRAHTIAVLLDPKSNAADIATPGHLFPLCAKPNGVLERRGHTEGSVDLMKIAGLKPAAVICEIIDEDGTMLRGSALENFAKQHRLPFVSIQDIVHYRLTHENWVELYSQAIVPTEEYGQLSVSVFRDKLQNQEIAAIHAPDFLPKEDTLIRLHSCCFTGDVLGSKLCDCGGQLTTGLKKLIEEKGVLLYLPQEGRGIGLGNKIKAYALQAEGMDTVEANRALGFGDDERDYAMAAHTLKSLQLFKIKLLTNNPLKVEGLTSYGIEVSEQVSLELQPNSENHHYLQTKKNKLNHLLTL